MTPSHGQANRMRTTHEPREPGKVGRHGWSMIACCTLLLVIAVVLVATEVVGSGLLVPVVACAVMVAMMVRGAGRT